MVSKPPSAPKASGMSRRLQSILRRIQDHGIRQELSYVKKQVSRISAVEEKLDGYAKGLLEELRQKMQEVS